MAAAAARHVDRCRTTRGYSTPTSPGRRHADRPRGDRRRLRQSGEGASTSSRDAPAFGRARVGDEKPGGRGSAWRSPSARIPVREALLATGGGSVRRGTSPQARHHAHRLPDGRRRGQAPVGMLMAPGKGRSRGKLQRCPGRRRFRRRDRVFAATEKSDRILRLTGAEMSPPRSSGPLADMRYIGKAARSVCCPIQAARPA